MWKFIVVGLLPVLASTNSFVVVPQDEVIMNYKAARGLLTPEQEEFLMELLAADDALIESTSRGIVDDILQALSGTGSNIRVNIVGGSPNQQQPNQPIPASAAAPAPPVNIINPTITLVSTPNTQEKTLINTTDTANSVMTGTPSSTGNSTENSASKPMSDLSPPSGGSSSSQGTPASASATIPGASKAALAPYPLQGASGTITQQMQTQSNVTTIGGNNNHLFQTISQVIRNSNSRNVTGIVDESLRIATPAPIREFVTGILNVVYCNGIRRLLGRC